MPHGTYGRIASRSGLALDHGITVRGGVIDPDYRGEIKVILYNESRDTYYLAQSERMAQLIVEKFMVCEPKLYEECMASKTERGDKGFGSSGN